MKILMISNMYPSKRFPSYGVFVKNFEESLCNKGIRVDKIVITKTNNKLFKILKYIWHYIKVFFCILLKKYDIVYVNYVSHNAIPVLMASKFKKINIYSNLHGSDLMPVKKEQNKFKKYTDRLLKLSSKIIVPSNFFKETVNEKYSIDKNRIFIYPSGGININKFNLISHEDINRLKEEYNIPIDERIIGFVGRIESFKGWQVFLNSISELVKNNKIKKRTVILVGNGTEIDKLKEYIQQNNLNEYIVTFNLLSQEELVKIYNLIDIFSFPTFGESLGLVGLEAMYCKSIIVGSDIPALREYIINDENGYRFEVGNYKMQVEYIDKLLNLDNIAFEKMKENARKKAKLYKSDVVAENINIIFK